MPAHIAPPSKEDYSRYFDTYLDWVAEDDLLQAQIDQLDEVRSALRSIDETTAGVIHPPYGWSIKQVVGHCIDNERIFAARAWRIGCGEADQQGYDQERLVAVADYDTPTLADLVEELEDLRKANIAMFRRMTDAMLDQKGATGGNPISPRAIAALQIGHLRYHLDIIRKRLATAVAGNQTQ